MSREKWKLIKTRKGFSMHVFRHLETALMLTIGLNMILGLAVRHVYLKRPEHHFYATNGVTPPQTLVSMSMPNQTDQPLLSADPADADELKLIPE